MDWRIVEIIRVHCHLYFASSDTGLDARRRSPRDDMDPPDIGVRKRGLQNAVARGAARTEYRDRAVLDRPRFKLADRAIVQSKHDCADRIEQCKQDDGRKQYRSEAR